MAGGEGNEQQITTEEKSKMLGGVPHLASRIRHAVLHLLTQAQ